MSRIALMAAGLVLAACSKTSPSSPVSGSAVAQGSEAAGAGGNDAAAAPRPPVPESPAPKKGPRMSAADEATIIKHYEKKGWGELIEIVMNERLPGMFAAEYSQGGTYGVIQGGKILEGKGLGAAGAYMRDVKLLTLSPTPRDMTTLLELFGALPPIPPGGYAAPDQFYNHARNPQLNPKVELGPGGGKLVLHYLLTDRVGARPNANERTVMRWTLTIPPDYKLAWREEETQFDVGAP